MKKKMLAVLLTVAVSMTAVACGDKASEEQGTETVKETTETAQQDTTAAEAVTAVGGYMKDLNAEDYVTMSEHRL